LVFSEISMFVIGCWRFGTITGYIFSELVVQRVLQLGLGSLFNYLLQISHTLLKTILFYIFFITLIVQPFGQTILSIHETYVDTLVYTAGCLIPHIGVPKEVIPNCVYVSILSLFITWSGPPESPWKIWYIYLDSHLNQ